MGNLLDNESGFLDANNRDPNYLRTEEVCSNEWFMKMLEARGLWREHKRTLHLDLHGCKDPPHHTAHLNIGLGAMSEREMGPEGVKYLDEFARIVTEHIAPLIRELNLKPAIAADQPPVKFFYPREVGEVPQYFSGQCAEKVRHTQTQQAITFCDFSHALQVEMSLALRRALKNDRDACDRLADGFLAAFQAAPSLPGR